MGSYTPQLLQSFGGQWECDFYDNFSVDGTLEANWKHPRGQSKWKWSAESGKEIWWEPSSSYIVKHPADPNLNVLRVGVWSDWFHRTDRIATQQAFGYGYFEAMVRFKGAENMHSAFWLLAGNVPDEPTAPDGSGLINKGIEIDVCEHRQCNKEGACIADGFNTAVHYGGYGKHHKSCGWKELKLPATCCQWAVFGCLHDESGIRWYVNGHEVNRANVHSTVPLHIYFSTEVSNGCCWSGKGCPKSYGPKEDPAGFVEVNYTGHWKRVGRGGAGGPGGMVGGIVAGLEQGDAQKVVQGVKEAGKALLSHLKH